MESAIIEHMLTNYNPTWLSCLDESMNELTTKFSTRSMHVSCKPNPFKNEYHTTCYGDDDSGNQIQ
jgi:hypothetical protein